MAIAGLSGGVLMKLDQPGTPAVAAGAKAATGSKTTARSVAGATPATQVVPPATTVSPPPTGAAGTTTPGRATSPATSAASGRATSPTTARRAAAATTTAVPAGTALPAGAAGDCSAPPTAGPVVTTRWGPVQVAATFAAGGALCDVETLESPSDHRKSVSINQQALPILRREALAAGSASIDVVSGATITSDAYATSLQSILDGQR